MFINVTLSKSRKERKQHLCPSVGTCSSGNVPNKSQCAGERTWLWRSAHLVSATSHGYQSWALAVSQCLRLSPSLQQRGTEAETGADNTPRGIESGTGLLTEFVSSFPDRGLLSPEKLLDHQYLQERKGSSNHF